jgi:hypothetical protein
MQDYRKFRIMDMKILVVSEIKYLKLIYLIKNVTQFTVLQYV